MRCEQARQLFDAYLDGELSASLATELGTHRLRCSECRQALALLEVSGHIVRTDQEPVQLEGNFTERLLGCMEQRSLPWLMRWRRQLYIGGTLAAAAVIALAFLGLFDNRDARVAGEKFELPTESMPIDRPTIVEVATADEDVAIDASGESLEAWIDRARGNIANKRESGESLRSLLDDTATQWGHILQDAASEGATPSAAPGADDTDAPSEAGAVDPVADRSTDG